MTRGGEHLSERDRNVLGLIEAHEKFGAGSPSIRDIQRAFGFKSKTQAERVIRRLERAGRVIRSDGPLTCTNPSSIQIKRAAP
jgi:SOS-response transcriptional repressor LexA